MSAEDDDGGSAFPERAVFQLGVSDDETEDHTFVMWSEIEKVQWTRMGAANRFSFQALQFYTAVDRKGGF